MKYSFPILCRFVNIGIRQKQVGTVSQTDGSFSLQVPLQNENDTLTFSMVGYSDLNIPIQIILHDQLTEFTLQSKAAQLPVVAITAGKLTEKIFGISKSATVLHITDGSTNQQDIFEIAQVMELDNSPSKIMSLNLLITDARADSGFFRINFYRYEKGRPGDQIVEQQIIQTHAIRPGWLTFDLSEYNIRLKGKFVASIEFLPSGKYSERINYEVKLGGSAKSFVRSASQGEWNIPPHHYRMYITALVVDKKNTTTELNAQEKESIPDFTLYSNSVKDSFSVFIRRPESYTQHTTKRFRVVYLLDANVYFDLAAQVMKENKIEDAILVGVGYKDFLTMDSLRNRDYTFPKAAASDSLVVSGGGDKFLIFLMQELIPWIDHSYQTDSSNRTLMGHSLGGYFTLYALMDEIQTTHHTIQNFVAASPSLDYGNSFLPKSFANFISQSDPYKRKLFVTYGKREDDEDLAAVKGSDTFREFVNLFSRSSFKNITVNSEVFPSFEHMETAVPTFTKALLETR